ncbi:MAG: MlaD family protein [Candidatus Omnitrophota bacterium]
MIFGKTKLEMKVGIFVFIGIIILIMFVLFIGDFSTWGTGYRINIVFKFINGVKIGAPVRFSGVDAGEVKTIQLRFVPEEQVTKVTLTCLLRKEALLPRDSTVWVNTLGLLGEKYLEIMPGKNYADCLKPGDTIIGNDPVPMHEVFELLEGMAEKIDTGISEVSNGKGTIGKLLYDDTVYNEVEALVKDLRLHPWKLFWKTKEKPVKR